MAYVSTSNEDRTNARQISHHRRAAGFTVGRAQQPAYYRMGQGGDSGEAWSEQPTTSRTSPLSLSYLRWIVGGIILLIAVLMLAGFFFASWMEIPKEGSSDDINKLTAWEIWFGRNDGVRFTLDVFGEDQKVGFDGVRGVDRWLIIIPIGALVLGVAAVQYMSGRVPRLKRLSPRSAAFIMLVVALLLFLYPFIWESLSSGNWDDSVNNSFYDADYVRSFTNELKDAYSTGHQVIYGLIALLAGIAAVALELVWGRARLES